MKTTREEAVYQPIALVLETEHERHYAITALHNAINELSKPEAGLWLLTLTTLRRMEELIKEA